MNYFFLVIAVLFLVGCTDNHKPAVSLSTKDSVNKKPDTFNVRDLKSDPSLQEDILLDTIEVKPNKRHTGITIVVPKIRLQDMPAVARQIDSVVQYKIKDFQEITRNDTVEFDTTWKMELGWSMYISPKNLYRTGKVISFAMENSYGYTLNASGYEYITINFDIEKKKRIRLNDYFSLETPADTAFLADILCRAVGCGPTEHALQYLRFPDTFSPLKFSCDKNNVYFFFDKGEWFAGGQIGAVKKQPIINHIKEEYR